MYQSVSRAILVNVICYLMGNKMVEQKIEQHYSSRGTDLETKILRAVQACGKKLEDITWKDISGIDEFHIRKSLATRDMAELIDLQPGTSVLDAGCGLGGPSLHLALEYGCLVTGIDLTQAFCDVAKAFSKRFGVENHVTYQQGSVLDLPFDDKQFDVVWTQHVSMNIEDKERFFAELFRVVKSGGFLACYDIIEGTGEPVAYPVPWANTPDISFLASEEQQRSAILEAGFSIESWDDKSQEALSWLEKVQEKSRNQSSPAPDFQLFPGDSFAVMMSNLIDNFCNGRTRVVQVIGQRREEDSFLTDV